MHLSNRILAIDEEPFFIALNLPPGVLRLTAGEPDFPSAPFVNEYAAKAVQEGQVHYTAPAGIQPLREGIAQKLKQENKLSYDPNEIVVTPGSSAAVVLALLASIDPGEEVLLPDPIWFHYSTLVKMAGGIPKPIKLDVKDGFVLHASEIERVASPKSRALILNNPSNPTGRVLSRPELDDIAGAAERLDLTVLSDEIYEKIVYPPFIHESIGTLAGMRERTIVTNGFSKGYALMGWRVGYAAAPREMIRKLDPLLGYTLVCASSVSQHAALESLRNPLQREYTMKMLEAWTRRRNLVMHYVSENPDILSARPPEGTFYAWIDVSGSGLDSKAAARTVLERANVGVMPGYLFGENGRNHVRVSFATSDSIVGEGMERLCGVLSKVRNENGSKKDGREREGEKKELLAS